MADYLDYEESYVGQLRKRAGDMKLIIPAARAIIQDEDGKILLIRRRDNGKWDLPAGGIELDESIMDCLEREVREETGLEVIEAIPIVLQTEPRFSYTNIFGKTYQMFTVVFHITKWQGKLVKQTSETTDARFYEPDNMPELSPPHAESINDLQNYTGILIVK